MRIFLLLTLALAACSSKQSPAQTIAKCEQAAYAQIGVQPDATSTLDYALSKQELVRACAVSAGLKFRSDAWSAYYPKLAEQVYRSYGIWTEKPGTQKYNQQIAPADAELKKRTAIAQSSSEFWE